MAQSLLDRGKCGQLTNLDVGLLHTYHFNKLALILVHVLEFFVFPVGRVLSRVLFWALDMNTSVYKDAHGDCLSLALQFAADNPAMSGGNT